ncbi:MAG TPA: prepilin-type N-terminal cleavage/methylation domain-containing protein [Planctomycetota bacterium]|nr:prepilin-type N-terminal cleavage/methylation domain-containing protein [Planctomycetota bacterium]
MRTNRPSAGPTSRRSGSSREGGMTLVELLVAFAVFLILVGLLVSLSTQGLETWQEGEARKDAYDRGRIILDQIADDLRGTFADNQWYVSQGRLQVHAGFYCDNDKEKDSRGAQRLRFVRTGSEDRMKPDPAMKILHQRGQGAYTDLWETAYLLNPAGQPTGLYRGVRYFDRATVDSSILEARVLEDTKSAAWGRHFTMLDSGVLWIGYRFWTKYTTTWDIRFPVKQVPRLMKQVDTKKEETQDKIRVGPHDAWDSSRGRISAFKLFYKELPQDDPDFAYPEIVQVTLVVESQSSEQRGAKVAEVIDESATTVRLNSSKGVPEAPDCVLIGTEWILYLAKEGETLLNCQRGARRTAKGRHELNDQVRFGETFITDVAIPAYREPVR